MTKDQIVRGIRNGLWLTAGLVVVLGWPSAAVGQTITGTVTFAGKPPALKPLSVEAEPVCHKKQGGKPVENEALVLGSGGTMANIMVWVSKGLPAGKTYPAPSAPVVLDQDGCVYKPHVMGIMVGQTYRILNSDGILHNIHTTSKTNPPINQAQPKFKPKIQIKIEKAEWPIKVQCDAHGWMHAYWIAQDHPYFAVTGADGSFTSVPDLVRAIEAEHAHAPAREPPRHVAAHPAQSDDADIHAASVRCAHSRVSAEAGSTPGRLRSHVSWRLASWRVAATPFSRSSSRP